LPHYKCLLGEKFRDEFLDFRAGEGKDAVVRATQDAKAGCALKSVPLRQVFIGRSATNTGRLSFGYFSLAKQRKVTGVLAPKLKSVQRHKAHQIFTKLIASHI